MLMNVEMLEIIAFFDLIPLTMSARRPDLREALSTNAKVSSGGVA